MKLDPGTYFGKPTRLQDTAGLRLTLSEYAPEQAQPRHVHANPTLFLLLSGDHCDAWRQGERVQPALTAVFHPTTEPHAARVGPAGMWGLNVEMTDSWLERQALSERDLGGYRLLDAVDSRLQALRLLAVAFQSGVSVEADLETRVLELLEPLVEAQTPPEHHGTPRWLRRAEDYLQGRYRDPISLRQVAEEVSVHPVYFARVFRRQHDCSVSEYVRALRLAEAGRLIVGEGWTLGEAAHEAGFADQAHLTRSFTRTFGFAPRTLRRVRALLSR